MNWFTNLFNSVIRRGHAEIKRLTQLDGKPGMGLGDIEILVGEIRRVADVAASGAEKHRMVAAWLTEKLGSKIPKGYAEVIVYIAYQIAKETLLKKS
jgi:hypothetical protein